MEEDIKILEDETNALGLFFKCNGTGKYKQALENLLKRYKELEEENKKLKDNYKNQIEQTTILAKSLNLEEDAPIDEMYAEINKLKTNSIPTSVIQNKLSEIDEKIKNYKSLQELHELQAQKFILELILEKGNN